MSEDKLYFAYGSNINLDQMAYRCPAAQMVGPVLLENYELLFRGNANGNGVATIKPKEGQQVYGLLWRITPDCERSLDIYEGYPRLYEKESVAVRDSAGRQLTVMAYVMTDGDRWRSPALPSEYYYQAGMGSLRGRGPAGDRAEQPQGLQPALAQAKEGAGAVSRVNDVILR